MEEAIEHIVSYFRHAAQGLEEKKQILYLLGPVGGGKSSLAEKLKHLMKSSLLRHQGLAGQRVAARPVQPDEDGEILEEDYGIPRRYLNGHHLARGRSSACTSSAATSPSSASSSCAPRCCARSPSPRPSRATRTTRTSPRWSARSTSASWSTYRAERPDAYSLLRRPVPGQPGLLEFVEMFKAPIKVLHPLLTATQEGNYKGTEGFGAIPFDGIMLAHSNESEWLTFKNNRNNEAFLDRIYIVKVPYCLRVSDEMRSTRSCWHNSLCRRRPARPTRWR
jgi:serine protein kinase